MEGMRGAQALVVAAILTGCGGGSTGAGMAQAPSSPDPLVFPRMDGSYNEPHGWGIVTYPNGTRYAGVFCGGKPHGHGVYTFPDGRRREVGVREIEGFGFPKGTRIFLPDRTAFIYQGRTDLFSLNGTDVFEFIFPDGTRFNVPDRACFLSTAREYGGDILGYIFPDGTIFDFPAETVVDNEGFIIPNRTRFSSCIERSDTYLFDDDIFPSPNRFKIQPAKTTYKTDLLEARLGTVCASGINELPLRSDNMRYKGEYRVRR